MGRQSKKNEKCLVCGINPRLDTDSYCHDCQKKLARERWHKKREGVQKKPIGGFIDLSGSKFGRLLVLKQAERRGKYIKWECLCDCGTTIEVITNCLKSGNTQSCGCFQKDMAVQANTTHGMSHVIPEYGVWWTMLTRCKNRNSVSFKNYGGRGITVCEEWNKFESFFEDMGRRPSDLHSIERKDNNKPYSKDNCIWATEEIQSRNRRNNVNITINGVTKLMIDWAKEYGVSENLVRSRKASGWPLNESILTTPKNKRR